MAGGPAQFLGNTVGEAAAFAAGLAVAPLLHPVVQTLTNEAWSLDPTRPIDPNSVAALVAQGAVLLDLGSKEASLTGISGKRFAELVTLAQRAPTYAEAQDLRRRNKITPEQLTHSFKKAQIEEQYWSALADLVDDRLDPAVVATAVQRTLLPNNGILPSQPSTDGSNVPPMPGVDIDPFEEAAASGIDADRFKVLARLVGLPASPDLAARMHFRKIITLGAFNQAILEGNTRGEWAPFLLQAFRDILTNGQYAEGQLRGFLTAPERRAKTAQHGMSDADSDLLYDLSGRSIPVHQITTGLARGGVFDGPIDTIPKAYLQSLQRGNLRPEYFNLAYANRYTYESVFVMRALVEAGDLSEADAHQDLLDIGWRPDRAKSVSAAWGKKAGTAKGNPWVAKAEQQWWTAAHKAFVKQAVPRTAIEPVMLTFVPDLAERDAIFQWWTNEIAVDAGVPPAA